MSTLAPEGCRLAFLLLPAEFSEFDVPVDGLINKVAQCNQKRIAVDKARSKPAVVASGDAGVCEVVQLGIWGVTVR